MFDDNWVGLGSTGSFMGNSIERSLHAVGGKPGLVVMVDADPAKPNRFELFLELIIYTVSGSLSLMNKGYSDLIAIVVFPNVLAETFDQILNAFNSRLDTQ